MHNGNTIEGVLIAKALTLEPDELDEDGKEVSE
jgi:hypothetical protein